MRLQLLATLVVSSALSGCGATPSKQDGVRVPPALAETLRRPLGILQFDPICQDGSIIHVPKWNIGLEHGGINPVTEQELIGAGVIECNIEIYSCSNGLYQHSATEAARFSDCQRTSP